MKLLRITCISVLVGSFAGCDFEISPWQTDAHCPGLSIEHNLQRLKTLESSNNNDDNFKVAVIGDPQQYPGDLEIVVGRLNQRVDIDFILLLGDIAETGIKQEFEWSCKALQKSNHPILTVIGNHDALSFGAEIWQQIFGEFNYSFRYKKTKFVAYNDNQYEFDNVPDRDWLSEQAEQTKDSSNLIALSHIEPWGRDEQLSEYLNSLGYDVALHAHNHKFSYYQVEGNSLPHFITADTQDIKYSVMTVREQTITFENCDPECVPATIEQR